MTKNEELIKKYKRYIKEMEKQIETMTTPQTLPLIAKVSVYKMVIIDLQEQFLPILTTPYINKNKNENEKIRNKPSRAIE